MKMKVRFVFLLLVCVTVICGCGTASDSRQGGAAVADSSAVRNEVVNAVLQRRSIRKYKPRPVERDKMARIVECGVYAPNGKGLQSWEVRIVDNPRLLSEIDSAYTRFMGKSGADSSLKAAYGAPVLVFIAYDTGYDLSQVDCGLLGGNMMLSAQSLGIGSCCLGGICRFINSPEGSGLLERLDFPDTHKLLYAIAFGYPDEAPEAKPRNMDKVRYVE